MVLVYFPRVLRYHCHNKHQKSNFNDCPQFHQFVSRNLYSVIDSLPLHRISEIWPTVSSPPSLCLLSAVFAFLCVYETHERLDMLTHATLSSQGLPSVMYTVYKNCFACVVVYRDWSFVFSRWKLWNGQAFWPSLPSPRPTQLQCMWLKTEMTWTAQMQPQSYNDIIKTQNVIMNDERWFS